MVLRNPLCSQLGLFVEFSPEDVLLGVEEAEDDGDLEAELLALTGEAGTTGRKPAPKGQGEFATVGAGTRWLRQVVGRAFPHSCGEPARSPGSSGAPAASAAFPLRGRLALLTCLGVVWGERTPSWVAPSPFGQSESLGLV